MAYGRKGSGDKVNGRSRPTVTATTNEIAKALDVTEAAINQRVGKIEDADLPDSASLTDTDLAEIEAADVHEYVEPWNRLPYETDAPWGYFCVYRDAGPARTFIALEREFGLAPSTVRNYANRFDWKDRALAFDQHEDRIYQTRRQIAIREMADRHATDIMETIDGLMIPVRALKDRIGDDPDRVADELDVLSTDKLVALSARTTGLLPNLMSAERLALGMPTEISQVEVKSSVKYELDKGALADVVEVLAGAGAFDGPGALGGPTEIIDVDVTDVEVHPEDTPDAWPES